MTTIVCTLLPGLASAAPPTQPMPQTVDFLAAHAGAKATLSEDGIGAIFGVPFAERPQGQGRQAFVKQFLDDNPGILGVATLDLAYDNDLLIANGKFTVFTYKQTVAEEDNLPMHGGFIKVIVLMGATEKIVYIGAVLKQEPEATLPDDVKSEQDALDTALAAYPQLTN